jgi:hypothetical protein
MGANRKHAFAAADAPPAELLIPPVTRRAMGGLTQPRGADTQACLTRTLNIENTRKCVRIDGKNHNRAHKDREASRHRLTRTNGLRYEYPSD